MRLSHALKAKTLSVHLFHYTTTKFILAKRVFIRVVSSLLVISSDKLLLSDYLSGAHHHITNHQDIISISPP